MKNLLTLLIPPPRPVSKPRAAVRSLTLWCAVLLSGCANFYTMEHGSWIKHSATPGCLFGGATEVADAFCAEKNFGHAGVRYIQDSDMLCGVCGTTAGPEVGATHDYCALNCRGTLSARAAH